MNILEVTWKPPKTYYEIPLDWELKDIEVRWDKLYYKGILQDLEGIQIEGDGKRPKKIEILEGEEAEDIHKLLA